MPKDKRTPEELINQRRRQMHVHSTIYYFLNTSIIDDALFDTWAVELANLQKQHPDLKKKGYMYSVFADWTGDTGMHLPVTDAVLSLAEWLVERHENGGGTTPPVKRSKAQKPDSDGWEGDVGYAIK